METSTGLLATKGGYLMTTCWAIWPRWFGGNMGGLWHLIQWPYYTDLTMATIVQFWVGWW